MIEGEGLFDEPAFAGESRVFELDAEVVPSQIVVVFVAELKL
jgi:hypothetical protein